MLKDQEERLHQVTEEDYLLNEFRVNTGGEGRVRLQDAGFSLGNQQAYFQMETDVLWVA